MTVNPTPPKDLTEVSSTIASTVTSGISHLVSSCREAISNNKGTAAVVGLVGLGILAYFTYSTVKSNSAAGRLEKLLSTLPPNREVSPHVIEKFLKTNWNKFGFDPCCNNDSIKQMLAQDIAALLNGDLKERPVKEQVQAILQHIGGVQRELSGVLNNVREDIQGSQVFRQRFEVGEGDQPVKLTVLQGQNGERRYLIGFQDNEKQVCWIEGNQQSAPITGTQPFHTIPAEALSGSAPTYTTDTHSYCSYLSTEDLHRLANSYAESWLNENFDDRCNNVDNREFLAKKIFKILSDHYEQPADVKEGIINGALSNFKNYMEQQLVAVNGDIGEDGQFREIFGIEANDAVESFHILADETHNEGKAPLHVILKSGKEIVIKPRSMLPELVLCGGEGSVFGQLGIGSYRVYNKEGYGYSEFLKNQQEGGNVFQATVDNPTHIDQVPGLKEYADKFIRMDQAAQALGLTDIHSGNIITVNGNPIPIDAEVIMLPTGVDGYQIVGGPCILTKASAGFKFYEETGDNLKNMIWIKGKDGRNIDRNQAASLINEYIRNTAYFRETYGEYKPPSIPEEMQKIISTARETLSQEPQRIVLVSTTDAVEVIKRSPEEGFKDFCNFIEEGAKLWGFELTTDLENLRGDFLKDVGNNDAPVFHFLPGKKALLYHGKVIGRLSESVKY